MGAAGGEAVSAAALPPAPAAPLVSVLVGDCLDVLRGLPADRFRCCVTSPPYFGLRDYGVAGQIGLEDSPEAFVDRLVAVFREVRRVLTPDGTLWLNIGDSYAGSRAGPQGGSGEMALRSVASQRAWRAADGSHRARSGAKAKDLLMIPALVALALRADGWWLRSAVVWHKPNPMPESVEDRPTAAYEHVFLLSRSERYFYDAEAIKEDAAVPGWDDGTRAFGGVNKHGAGLVGGKANRGRVAGVRPADSEKVSHVPGAPAHSGLHRAGTERAPARRNARNVWTIPTQPFSAKSVTGWDEDHDHYAVMPPALAERCILAGSAEGDHVLDPFGGAGTTGLVAHRIRRSATLVELNPKNARLARARITAEAPLLRPVE